MHFDESVTKVRFPETKTPQQHAQTFQCNVMFKNLPLQIATFKTINKAMN